jgi:hypothetical protein
MGESGLFGNLWALTFLLWPGATILCALLNMLITWQFSWSELVIDYVVGGLIGVCFYFGVIGEVSAVEGFFLTVSTGLPGLLHWAGMFADMEPGVFFLLCSGAVAGVVVIGGALDYGAAAIGWSEGDRWKNVLLSLVIFPIKVPFALFTTAVGVIIGVIGLIYRATLDDPEGNGFGFAGGVFWFEWGMDGGYHATTFGGTVNEFRGEISDTLAHELVHTRQYCYLHDWLGIFYFTISGLWGLASSAIHAAGDDSVSFDVTHMWAADNDEEVGNPIEMVPTHRYG